MHFLIGADIVTFYIPVDFFKKPVSVLPGPISTKVSTPSAIIASMLCCHRTPDATCWIRRPRVSAVSRTYWPVTFVTYGIFNSIKPTPSERFGQPLGRSFHHRGMERAAYVQRKYPLCACFF